MQSNRSDRAGFRSFLGALLLTLITGALHTEAEAQVQAFSPGIRERAVTRIVYFDPAAQRVAGEINIAYGRPAWKEAYRSQLDELNDRLWRLGADFWTVLDSNLPFKVSGTMIPPGLHYLAVRRSSGKQWELVFIDPDKTREARLDASEILANPQAVPITATASLEVQERKESAPQLEVVLQLETGSIDHAQLRITWGNYQMSAPLEIEAPGSAEKTRSQF